MKKDRFDYDHRKIESRWQKKWEEAGIYQPDLKRAKKPFYNLMMFPYPSAEGLHVGNMYAFTGADVYGRFQRMRGYDVFEPIGLDGFGIHSENYAIQIGKHPMEQAKVSEKRFYEQLQKIGNGFAWKQKLETYDPEYYRFTQWLFVQMFKRGLAYRKKSLVNWCPSCKTVLADEQVEGGVCERCKSTTTKEETEQWFFKITSYADRLLENIDGVGNSKIQASNFKQIQNYKKQNSKRQSFGPVGRDYDVRRFGLRWPEKIKTAQRNWIGRKEGINIVYLVEGRETTLTCFTTRPDTNFGATFVVLGPEHPLLVSREILGLSNELWKKVEQYREESAKKSEIERLAEGRKKSGVFLECYCINDLNGYRMPVYVSDFVLGQVGTGAVVGVPGHDERDFEFAQEFGLPVIRVVVGSDGDSSPIKRLEQVQEEAGTMVNSEFLNGMEIHEATEKIMDYMEEKGMGRRVVDYKLRDWIISRQRYWAPPIPMLFCKKCAREGRTFKDSTLQGMEGWWPVSEEELPVILPYIEDWMPTGDGRSPLEKASDEWLYTKCPSCGNQAKRETDVSDTFLDSSWYFLRYPSVISQNSKSQAPNFRPKDDLLWVDKQSQNTNDQNEKRFEYRNSDRKIPWDREITKRWLPVDAYIGGAEHAVLHLLYSRFVTMALHDWGYLEFEEPLPFLFSHGLIIKDGAKMSKSRGNVVIPDDYIKKCGSDTLRAYLMFLGRYNQGGDFRDSGIAGMGRFLNRVWRLYIGLVPHHSDSSHFARNMRDDNASLESVPALSNTEGDTLRKLLHRTIKKVTGDIEKFKYNTAIAAIMEFVNAWESAFVSASSRRLPIPSNSAGKPTPKAGKLPFRDSETTADDTADLKSVSAESRSVLGADAVLSIADSVKFLKLLAPFAPYMTEELFQVLRKFQIPLRHSSGKANHKSQTKSKLKSSNSKFDSIHKQPWPEWDEKLAKLEELEIPIQVNGKLRGVVVVASEKAENQKEVVELAKKQEKVARYLQDKKIRKTIWVSRKLVNFVV